MTDEQKALLRELKASDATYVQAKEVIHNMEGLSDSEKREALLSFVESDWEKNEKTKEPSAESFSMACPSCKKVLRIQPKAFGKVLPCPSCKFGIHVPSGPPVPQPKPKPASVPSPAPKPASTQLAARPAASTETEDWLQSLSTAAPPVPYVPPPPPPVRNTAVFADTIQAPNQQVVVNVINQNAQVAPVYVHPPKSVAVAILLALFFGSLGMFYSTVTGALVMLVINLLLLIPTGGMHLLITRPICVIWAAMAVNNTNAGRPHYTYLTQRGGR